MTVRLILYSREACGLCDEMLAQLEPLLSTCQASVEVVDIGGDPELMRRFGLRIPVLLCQGEILCEGRLDADLVEQRLRRHS
ncbi:MAG: glutaredoxin family protein [Gammaproteobacteria bacterium]|nr:glutaredoxin family protein [Gammaproteobacteria bacterium]